jgi:hypothetical protein
LTPSDPTTLKDKLGGELFYTLKKPAHVCPHHSESQVKPSLASGWQRKRGSEPQEPPMRIFASESFTGLATLVVQRFLK